MMGCAVLPHLQNLVNCITHGLSNEQQKVRTMTTLGLAALAEAAAPFKSVHQQAADLITWLATVVIEQCSKDRQLCTLGSSLAKKYLDMLGSIIAAKGVIVNVVGMTQMNPPLRIYCRT